MAAAQLFVFNGGQWVAWDGGSGGGGGSVTVTGGTLDEVTTILNPVTCELDALDSSDALSPLRVATAANLTGTTGALMTSRPGDWIVFSDPGAATLATATKLAGGAGKVHVITSISACVYMPNAQGGLTLRLIDGASGGTVIGSWKFPIGATTQGREFVLSGLNIVLPTVNGPATLEFSAAPAAGNFQSVAMTGYTVHT